MRAPERYGVVEQDEDGMVISIEEKPKKPKSSNAVVGLYFYGSTVVQYTKQLKPSQRGELEITDLNQLFLEKGMLRVSNMGRGYAWLDTGTHSSLLDASNFVRTITDRQGMLVGSPDEVAYKNLWISKSDFCHRAELYGKSAYGNALLRVIKGVKVTD